jgi:hypothetical protein
MLEIRSLKITPVKTQKWRIVSARQNLLLQKGVQAQGHSMKRSRQQVLIFIPDAPLLGLVKFRCTICSCLANVKLGNLRLVKNGAQ